jgi:hypothetical protein
VTSYLVETEHVRATKFDSRSFSTDAYIVHERVTLVADVAYHFIFMQRISSSILSILKACPRINHPTSVTLCLPQFLPGAIHELLLLFLEHVDHVEETCASKCQCHFTDP